MKNQTISRDNVGDTYTTTRYAVLNRRVGTEGSWYGTSTYKTLEEAQAALRGVTGNKLQVVAGLIGIDFGQNDGYRYDYKIVKQVCQNEVIETYRTR